MPSSINGTEDDDENNSSPEAIVVESDSFILAWEDDNPDLVTEYTVFFRTHGTDVWTVLATVTPEDELKVEINESMLARGEWDFGITSTLEDYTDSEMHTSLEATTIPSTGWYLIWT